jgi:HAD superfamily hydrolase (TIGR01509 family)
MKSRAVIFDRDGVLTYFDIKGATSFFQPLIQMSLDELFQRWQKWGAQTGFPSSFEEEQLFFAGFCSHLRDECDLTEAQYRALRDSNYVDFVHPFPEVPEVLSELKKRGILVGVLSNFSLASLELSLESAGILKWIDIACAATVIGYAKPQAEAYRHVATLLQTPPQACLFFDDEEPCVVGAQAVGMAAYLVDRQRNHDRKANHIVYDLTAALDLLS